MASWFETRGFAALLTMRVLDFIPSYQTSSSYVPCGKLPNQLRRGGQRVLDLPKEPNLATPASVRNRNRIPQLRRIETHESFAIITHDSPSLREALPGPSG